MPLHPFPATSRRTRRATVVVAAASAATALAFVGQGPAHAATTGVGATSLQITSGALSVNSVGTATTLTALVGGSVTGLLPSVSVTDATGSGAGWNVTVQASSLTSTGTWSTTSGTTLVTTTSGAYTGTADGVTYVVTVAAGGLQFSYTSNDPADASGGPTAINIGGATAVGTKGVTITVPAAAGNSVYKLKVGTQAPGAIVLATAASGAGVTPAGPTLVGNGTAVAGGGAGTYGTAVKMASAAAGTGAGSYSIVPGVTMTADASSLTQTYSASIQYSIVSGP